MTPTRVAFTLFIAAGSFQPGCGAPASAPAPVAPPKRAHHAIVYDEDGERVLVTGGSTPHTNGGCCVMYNDLWSFDGTRWAALPSSGAQMSGMRLAFDSRARRVVSFGGWMSGQSLPDLRILQNDAWAGLPSLTQMPATEAGFVYDSRRNRFVAFGGAGPNGANGDTWEFDGNAWAKVLAAGPPARSGFAMVYDEARGRTVVFGGIGAASPGGVPPTYGDVWEFDGAAWTQIPAVNGPSPRSESGATYDSQRRQVILFGGAGVNQVFGDLWAWNGTAWTQLADASVDGPEPRGMGYVAYDKRRDRVVLFGGRKEWPNDLNDTWEWDGSTWKRLAQ